MLWLQNPQSLPAPLPCGLGATLVVLVSSVLAALATADVYPTGKTYLEEIAFLYCFVS